MAYGEEFPITRGDTEPYLEIQAKQELPGVPEEDWAAIDWTGATAVEFAMRPIGSQAGAVVTGSGEFVEPRDSTGLGLLRYRWADGDTDRTSGLYEAKFRVTVAGGGIRSVPTDDFVLVNITPAV